jgi:hypothetical protein
MMDEMMVAMMVPYLAATMVVYLVDLMDVMWEQMVEK